MDFPVSIMVGEGEEAKKVDLHSPTFDETSRLRDKYENFLREFFETKDEADKDRNKADVIGAVRFPEVSIFLSANIIPEMEKLFLQKLPRTAIAWIKTYSTDEQAKIFQSLCYNYFLPDVVEQELLQSEGFLGKV